MSQTYSTIFTGLAGSLVSGSVGYAIPRVTQHNALGVSITEGWGWDLTREGRHFAIARSAGVTGIAPVQAQATTAAQWVLWNTSSTKTCWFDMLGMILDSGVGGATGHVVYCADITAPAQTGLATGLSAINMSGSATGSTVLAIKSGVTVTAPAAPFWYPVAFVSSAITPGILGTQVARYGIGGGIALQPLHGLAMYIAGAAGTSPLFGPCAEWFEAVDTLG